MKLLLAALLCLPVLAAGPHGRTLKELVELTDGAGKLAAVGDPMSGNLGFAKSVSGKTLSYDDHQGKGLKGHDFTVVRDGAQVAALIWSYTGFKEGVVDSFTFRSSRDGKLVSAVSAAGKMGHVVQAKMNVKDSKTRKLFDDEVRFFLVDSAALKPEK